MRGALRPLLAGALAVTLGACASAPANVKLVRHDPDAGYRYANLASDDGSEELFVILAFSGGGTRAAAFSFGVMEGLREAAYRTAGGERRLLDDVDVIASVSGGSFTAAYYALFPGTFFADFPRDFLHRNIERARLARPPARGTGSASPPRGSAASTWRPSSTTRPSSGTRRSATSPASRSSS